MTVAGKVLWRLASRYREARNKYFLLRFILLEAPGLNRLIIGAKVRFEVPVRTSGLGFLTIGSENTFGYWAAPRLGNGEILLQPRNQEAAISIGNKNAFNNNVTIIANERVSIGNGCQIGDQVSIYDSDFHEMAQKSRNRSHGLTKPVSIGDNVWLGSRVVVLKGVTIGDNSVIGAMSVVTRTIPANCIAVGVPAKIVRSLEP